MPRGEGVRQKIILYDEGVGLGKNGDIIDILGYCGVKFNKCLPSM